MRLAAQGGNPRQALKLLSEPPSAAQKDKFALMIGVSAAAEVGEKEALDEVSPEDVAGNNYRSGAPKISLRRFQTERWRAPSGSSFSGRPARKWSMSSASAFAVG